MKKIFLIILFSLFLVSCSNQQKDAYIVLSSDMNSPTSSLTYIDNLFDKQNEQEIGAQGLSTIILDNNKPTIISPFTSKIVQLTTSKTEIFSSNKPHPLFYLPFGSEKMVIYNHDAESDINYYTYEFSKGNQKETLRVKGIPFLTTQTNNHVYVFLRDLTEEPQSQFSIIEINLKQKKVTEKIHIEGDLMANELIINEGILYSSLIDISSGESFILEYELDSGVKELNTLKDNNVKNLFFEKDTTTYFTVHNHNAGTKLNFYNKNSRALERELTTDQVTNISKYINGYLHFVTEAENTKYLNKMSLENGEILDKIQVPYNTVDYAFIQDTEL